MNIFFLANQPDIIAELQCDRHAVKMILESVQMLSTNHHLVGDKNYALVKPTHANHPSTIWARQSTENYQFLYNLTVAMIKEYEFRYNNSNTYRDDVMKLKNIPSKIKDTKLTKFAVCMPDQYKHDDPIQSYRNFYINDKKDFCYWTNRLGPDWFYQGVNNNKKIHNTCYQLHNDIVLLTDDCNDYIEYVVKQITNRKIKNTYDYFEKHIIQTMKGLTDNKNTIKLHLLQKVGDDYQNRNGVIYKNVDKLLGMI